MISVSPARCVQVLYTGGTIGMVRGPHGLRPASDFAARMAAALQNHPRPLPTYRFTELAPPIDSATLTHTHWQQMHAALIDAAESGACDAVLLLHGTDTLAYTAAALAHLLVDYPLPVVLTGAIHPADFPTSDAWPNVCGALAALGAGSVRSVAVHFHGQLFDPLRVTKWRSHTADAFIALPRPRTEELYDFDENVPFVRYRIEVGHNHRIRPKDIVGAIANETGIGSRYIGQINLYEDYSTVELPPDLPPEALQILATQTRIRQQPIQLRRLGDDEFVPPPRRFGKPRRRRDRDHDHEHE